MSKSTLNKKIEFYSFLELILHRKVVLWTTVDQPEKKKYHLKIL